MKELIASYIKDWQRLTPTNKLLTVFITLLIIGGFMVSGLDERSEEKSKETITNLREAVKECNLRYLMLEQDYREFLKQEKSKKRQIIDSLNN